MNSTIKKVFTGGKTIPVVFATDQNFFPYMFVAITSLIEKASPSNNYDIVILFDNIEEYPKQMLEKLNSKNISIRFFNMSEIMKQYKNLWYTHWLYTEAMYYRFIIPEIFKDYEKVLYLDGDIIINCDIAELYDIDLKNNWIGAIIENSMKHPKSPAYDYIEKVLNLNKNEYFSSGVMIFNIKILSQFNFFKSCITILKNLKTPLFPDQDVLNLVCNKHVKYIDITFNLQWNILNYYKNIENYISEKNLQQLNDAKKNPKILHYCGAYKPWKRPDLPYSEYFWHYARKTPFYEEFIYKNTMQTSNREIIKNAIFRRKIYFNYLRCKCLRLITFGKTQKRYNEKTMKLKKQIQDYRKTLSK